MKDIKEGTKEGAKERRRKEGGKEGRNIQRKEGRKGAEGGGGRMKAWLVGMWVGRRWSKKKPYLYFLRSPRNTNIHNEASWKECRCMESRPRKASQNRSW
jgi:hypothetical protein